MIIRRFLADWAEIDPYNWMLPDLLNLGQKHTRIVIFGNEYFPQLLAEL
jgi:hypothetical protein